MMEFLAANFNLPTIIVSIFVFGSCGGGGCGSHGGCTGNCKTCGGACHSK